MGSRYSLRPRTRGACYDESQDPSEFLEFSEEQAFASDGSRQKNATVGKKAATDFANPRAIGNFCKLGSASFGMSDASKATPGCEPPGSSFCYSSPNAYPGANSFALNARWAGQFSPGFADEAFAMLSQANAPMAGSAQGSNAHYPRSGVGASQQPPSGGAAPGDEPVEEMSISFEFETSDELNDNDLAGEQQAAENAGALASFFPRETTDFLNN